MVAVLPERVELVTVVVRVPELRMPPPVDAELPEMVELVTVRVPELRMPPPLPLDAELPEMVELVTVTVPWFKFKMPPPLPLDAELPEMVELVTVRVPALKKPPPPKPEVIFAPETVTPEIERLPPAAMSKILKSRVLTPLFPLMVRVEAPGPVMVRVPRVPVPAPTVSLALRI